MSGPNRPKKILVKRTDLRLISPFTFTPPSPPPLSLAKQREKKEHSQFPPEKENQKPAKKIIKPTSTDGILSIPFPPFSPE